MTLGLKPEEACSLAMGLIAAVRNVHTGAEVMTAWTRAAKDRTIYRVVVEGDRDEASKGM